jgi:Arc/MetJ family transcription regulator
MFSRAGADQRLTHHGPRADETFWGSQVGHSGRGAARSVIALLPAEHYVGDVQHLCIHSTSWRLTVALTQIDIDNDALTEAMRLSGAKTKKDTVNLALREFAARHRRIAALEHYATLAAGWDFEGWEHRRAAEKDPAE